MSSWLRVLLIAIGSIIFAFGTANAVKIEQSAGYYECPGCRHRYVPTCRSVFLSRHRGRDRKMICPECGERGWHKKVMTKE